MRTRCPEEDLERLVFIQEVARSIRVSSTSKILISSRTFRFV
jgi:hypothetical protein